MERENPSDSRSNLADLRQVVEHTFLASGYAKSVSSRPAPQVQLDFVYSGNGMVWGVVFVDSLREIMGNWSSSS